MKNILFGFITGTLMIGSSVMAEEQIINNTSAKCLDTTGQAVNGAVVRMWNCTNHPNQLWEIINVPNAGQRLKNKATGFCLDVYSGRVRMWQCTNHPNQLWSIIPMSGNRYQFRNKASGLCLDTNNGQSVRTWQCVNHDNQKWMRSVIQ